MSSASPTISDHTALVERLTPFDVVIAMRERTPIPGVLLEQLANLRLLVTTGRRNASIDVTAAPSVGSPCAARARTRAVRSN